MKRIAVLVVMILVAAGGIASLTGCGVLANKVSLYQRSVVIENTEIEKAILAKASITSADAGIKVAYLRGTPYEMGFQHGRLLQKEINEFYNSLYSKAKLATLVKGLDVESLMDEVYDLMDPYIPIEEKEEMRGLAHGANVPLRFVHWVHCIGELSEYGLKMRFLKIKGTSCTNIAAFGKATKDGNLYALRVLDWARQLGAQKNPVILIHKPDHGNASVTFSYAGFIGAISGMNDKNMSFGEMGYGDPPGESLEGTPFIFLFRKLMRESNNVDDAIAIIKNTVRTSSYIYMITDSKATDGSKKAVMLITDRNRVKVIIENTDITDERKDGGIYPGFENLVYGGAKDGPLYSNLKKYYGSITPQVLMEMTKEISLDSNMQNVIFKPDTFEAWISNASMSSEADGRAYNQKWVYFNFSDALKR